MGAGKDGPGGGCPQALSCRGHGDLTSTEVQANAQFDWELEFSGQAVSESVPSESEVPVNIKFGWELEFSREAVSKGVTRGDQSNMRVSAAAEARPGMPATCTFGGGSTDTEDL
jgi:hypothetical protein